jgi:hypothetical protein
MCISICSTTYILNIFYSDKYSSAPVSTVNTFQDTTHLHETMDNTKCYV